MTIMEQARINAAKFKVKKSDHAKEEKKYTQKMQSMMKYIQSSSPEIYSVKNIAKDKIRKSSRMAGNFHDQIVDCENKMNDLGRNIDDLRNKMAEIESVVENSSTFPVKSMRLGSIESVFLEIEKWNQIYQDLKDNLRLCNEKMKKSEDKMIKYEIAVRENIA